MWAFVIEGDPLVTLFVKPQNNVTVEKLEMGRPARVEVLEERDRVPVVSPSELGGFMCVFNFRKNHVVHGGMLFLPFLFS